MFSNLESSLTERSNWCATEHFERVVAHNTHSNCGAMPLAAALFTIPLDVSEFGSVAGIGPPNVSIRMISYAFDRHVSICSHGHIQSSILTQITLISDNYIQKMVFTVKTLSSISNRCRPILFEKLLYWRKNQINRFTCFEINGNYLLDTNRICIK